MPGRQKRSSSSSSSASKSFELNINIVFYYYITLFISCRRIIIVATIFIIVTATIQLSLCISIGSDRISSTAFTHTLSPNYLNKCAFRLLLIRVILSRNLHIFIIISSVIFLRSKNRLCLRTNVNFEALIFHNFFSLLSYVCIICSLSFSILSSRFKRSWVCIFFLLRSLNFLLLSPSRSHCHSPFCTQLSLHESHFRLYFICRMEMF